MPKKKKFIVMPREQNVVLDGITTERGHRDFNGKTYMHVDDPGEARDIDLKYGKGGSQEVYIAEDEQYARALNGEKWEVQSSLRGTNVKLLHNYTFGPLNIEQNGGNERVRVKTKDGSTVVSLVVAREEGLEIIPKRRRAKGRKKTWKN